MDTNLENCSDCSSGCESGWTMYLETSSISLYESRKRNGILDCEERKRSKETDDEEEEDLSMISDASSGHPHFVEEEVYVKSNNSHAPPIDAALRKNSGKMKKTKENRSRKVPEEHSLLDDTASSPVFNLSNNNFRGSNNYASAENLLEISQGYSATHFEGRSGYYHYQGRYDFCHSSQSGNFLQQNHSSSGSSNLPELNHKRWWKSKRMAGFTQLFQQRRWR